VKPFIIPLESCSRKNVIWMVKKGSARCNEKRKREQDLQKRARVFLTLGERGRASDLPKSSTMAGRRLPSDPKGVPSVQ